MTIEIWSDVVCPFCYIGKRHLEAALQELKMEREVVLIWKSFILNPELDAQMNYHQSIEEFLSNSKNISLEESKAMIEHVRKMAANAGLLYRFDLTKVASSMPAHCLLQWAKERGLGNVMKEQLLQAYFCDGIRINDPEQLLHLVEKLGLNRESASNAFVSNEYLLAVDKDLKEARDLGLRGVPFFVFEQQYGLSGAQPVQHFIDTLRQIREQNFSS